MTTAGNLAQKPAPEQARSRVLDRNPAETMRWLLKAMPKNDPNRFYVMRCRADVIRLRRLSHYQRGRVSAIIDRM